MNPISQSSSSHQVKAAERPVDPGVRIPPPAIYLVAFLASLWLEARFPLPFLARPIAVSLGAVFLAVGALFIVTAIPTMLRGHGTLNTAAPSAALVVSGPYRYSRNPMYVGLLLVYSGLAVVFAIVWALPLLIPLIAYTYLGAIAPEERYLDAAFGDAYRAYKTHVRRWL